MGAQGFNFAPKFPQNENFQPQILYVGQKYTNANTQRGRSRGG